jgi:F-type H+-transporting ATPase subunit epsilon
MANSELGTRDLTMAATLKLEIVTPEGKVYSEDVEMVTLPGTEGELGVFPLHTPLMTQIVAGELAARKGGQDFFLAVGEGFAEITGDHVCILTDMAIKAGDIDERKAEEARQRAEVRLREKLSDGEEAMVKAALAHSMAQIKVKRRRS